MLKQFSINNLKSRKSIILIIVIMVVIISIYFAISVFQRASFLRSIYKEPYVSFQPSDKYMPDEIIVRFRDDYIPSYLMNGKSIWLEAQEMVLQQKSSNEKLELINSEFKKIGVESFSEVYGVDDPSLKGFYILKLKEGSNLIQIQNELSKVRFLYSTEVNNEVELFALPNDPQYSQLWGMEKIQAPTAWDVTKGSQSVVVAVIDSGVESSHPDLSANMVGGYDFANNDSNPVDDVGHGTHVAGTVGAVGNNSVGVVGVNWNVKIMPLKVCVPSGNSASCDTVATAQAIQYAADNGAKVINMSLGGRTSCRSGTQYDVAVSYAVSKGVLVVVAAGNGHPTTRVAEDASLYSPAGCSGVLAVGASTPTDSRASFSNFGSSVGIAAPGTGTISTWIGGGYKSSQGTSMASPHVAGAAALLMSASPSLSASQIKNCLIQGADAITTDQPIGPRLNLPKAMQVCGALSPQPTSATPVLTTGPTSTLTPTILPTGTTPTIVPTSPPAATAAPTAPFRPEGTPTPTPSQYFTCAPDPNCAKNGKSIQLCPLVCKPI